MIKFTKNTQNLSSHTSSIHIIHSEVKNIFSVNCHSMLCDLGSRNRPYSKKHRFQFIYVYILYIKDKKTFGKQH